MSEFPTDAMIRLEAQRYLLTMEDFCRSRFDLGPDWKIFMELDFSESRTESRGGWTPRHGPFVSLSLYRFRKPVTGFLEYASFQRHAVIGNVVTTDWRLYLEALCAHEVAHTVQFSLSRTKSSLALGNKTYRGLGKFSGGHGEFFRRIYAILRREYINHKVQPGMIGAELKSGVSSGSMAVDEHRWSARKFRHSKYGDCMVIGKNSRGRKYPIIFQNSEGQLFKTREDDLAVYFS